MLSSRNFQLALIFSLIAHSALVIRYPALNILNLTKKPEMIKISYMKNPPQLTEAQKKMSFKKTPHVKLPSQINSFEKKNLIFTGNKEILVPSSRPSLPKEQPAIKPTILRPDIMAIKKKITLPPVETGKLDNPTYVSYYQFVREKIRRAAYQNYSRSETGEIYIAFVISSSGVLKDVRLVEEKSSPKYYLKETALRSVRDASPFPAFPKDLDYPQLSFNVIISFEIE